MAESTKNTSESQEENHFENEDNRLPYEPPKLRKDGKVSNATQVIPIIQDFDNNFGPPFSNDLS